MEPRKVKKQISAACHYAYTRLALNYYMYYEIALEGDILESRLRDMDRRYHQQLNAFLAGESETGELDRLRNEAASAMETNTAYTDAFQVYEYIMNRLESRFGPQLMGDRTALLNEEEMASEILAYITDTDQAVVVNERIQSVLGQLPVRLTRQKFFAMMEEGLSVYKGSGEKSLDDMLYILRSEAMLVRPQDMETGYEDLHSILREFEQADYKNMTVEAYRHLTSEMERASQILMDATSEIVLFMDLINDLYVLMLSRPSAVMEVAEENRLKGLLTSLLSLFEGGAVEPIPRNVTDSLSMLAGRQEAYFEQWMRQETVRGERIETGKGQSAGIEKGQAAGAEKGQSGAEEGPVRDTQEEKLRIISLLMSGSSFMSLEPEGTSEEKMVDDAMFQEKMDLIKEELSASWEGRPKALVRSVMAKILSRLPIFFGSLEELRMYVEGSLRSCTDVGEKQMTMKLIRMLMDLDGFDFEDD